MKNLFVITAFLLTQLLKAQTYTMVDLFNRNQRYGEGAIIFTIPRDILIFTKTLRGSTHRRI